jgi:uncharacterized membrane protein YphA (DoxX/SURF4 family)
LRIMVGLLFMQHGLSKLFGFPTGAGVTERKYCAFNR